MVEAVQQEIGRIVPARLAVGIVTGQFVVGSLGSEQSFRYTAMGEGAYVARQLATSIAKPSSVVIDEATYAALKGSFPTSSRGEATLKGRQNKLLVYELLRESPS